MNWKGAIVRCAKYVGGAVVAAALTAASNAFMQWLHTDPTAVAVTNTATTGLLGVILHNITAPKDKA